MATENAAVSSNSHLISQDWVQQYGLLQQLITFTIK